MDCFLILSLFKLWITYFGSFYLPCCIPFIILFLVLYVWVQFTEYKEGGECSAKEGSWIFWRYSSSTIYGSVWAGCSQDNCNLWIWGELVIVFNQSTWHQSFFLTPQVFQYLCSYTDLQVWNLTAAYVMKCDDDTFIRLDAVMNEVEHIAPKRSLYMGNLNLLHRPLRSGKWAVTFEVSFAHFIFISSFSNCHLMVHLYCPIIFICGIRNGQKRYIHHMPMDQAMWSQVILQTLLPLNMPMIV